MDYNIIIDDYIGGWWSSVNKQSIRRQLSEHQGEHVDVKISSLGGSLDDGLDIRQQFLDHGDVTVYLHSFVASAATVIAMTLLPIIYEVSKELLFVMTALCFSPYPKPSWGYHAYHRVFELSKGDDLLMSKIAEVFPC